MMTMPDEREIFDTARRLGDATARAAYLAEACGGETSIRQRVEALLQVHDEQQSFLASPAITADPPLMFTVPGTVIGRYKILEPIGEGGYGTVFMAEQTTPVQRRVALKIIKAGMDTRQVIARFEAERQALALMDHPNIAKVFDAGVTDTGRPYFVMELVKGMPITKYCDEHRLAPRARLELFIQVCQAVQHAHQKGIIHRDLKPKNVLVARYDGEPVPKVIDFGVAKATGQRLTERTMFTGFGDVIGTPQYMSPEQAELNQLDVDTRSDIYSLGVLLYELLTGTTPLESKRVKEAALLEVLRVIREEEPPRPSTRLTTTDQLPSIAAQRGLEPAKLSGLVRGELDWIVMKALEKDRARRYETANGFAADVQRYLAGEAVHAVPPSRGYRVRKFLRRNRGPALAAAVMALLLVTGTAISTWQAVRAMRAAEREAHERTKAEAARAAEATQRTLAQAKEAEANAVVTFFEERVFSAARPKGQEGGEGKDVSLLAAITASLPALEESFADQPLVEARLRRTLGVTFMHLGEAGAAEAQFSRALALCAKHLSPDHPTTLSSMLNLATSYAALGRDAEALRLREQTLAACKRVLPADHPLALSSMGNLAASYADMGRHAEALNLREQTLATRKRVLPADHPDTIESMDNLAASYSAMGRNAEALTLREEMLAVRKRVLPADHPDTLLSMLNLASTYGRLGRLAEALRLYEETLAAQKRVLPAGHPDTLLSMGGVAISLAELDRGAEAVPIIDECVTRAAGNVVHPQLIPELMDVRLRHFQKANDPAGCRATAAMWEKRDRRDAASLYDAACCRAVASAVQAKAGGADAEWLAKQDADEAMAWLTKAVAAGYGNVSHMKQDKDLDALREREDFKKLIAELENKKE
jgi:tetratricopeptide (TPR) repeat protein